MKWSRSAVLGALAASPALAQMPSLCDMYTTALLMNNTAENQYTLITLVVNTALIGNYTKPNHNAVTGILVPGQYMGTNVTLLPYFNGGFVSTNQNNNATSMNFLDGGGAIPLAENKPANDMTSNQYKLVTHLYEFFGALLGCSMYNTTAFPAYGGNPKMYEVHKFMNLDPNEMGYFIQEVGLSAASFGVSAENVTYIGEALANLFDMRCSARTAVLPGEMPDLQAICINSACPVATSGAICTSYNKMSGSGVQPATASVTPGPQLSDLAPQLSSIDAGLITPAPPGGGLQSFSTSIFTTEVNSTSEVMTSLIPIGGAITTDGSTIPMSVITSVMETTTSGSMTITTEVPSTVENPALITSVSSVTSVVVTSGGSTFTTAETTAVASTMSGSKGAAPIQTAAAGMMAMVGVAGLVGQML